MARMEYLTFYRSIPVFCLFIQSIFSKDYSRWVQQFVQTGHFVPLGLFGFISSQAFLLPRIPSRRCPVDWVRRHLLPPLPPGGKRLFYTFGFTLTYTLCMGVGLSRCHGSTSAVYTYSARGGGAMPPEPTPKQKRFLNYLEGKMAHSGQAPSLRQAAADLGVSHGAVSQMIRTLEEKGLIRRDGRYSRTLHLLNRAGQPGGASRWLEVPIIGRIAAGLPLYAQQEWDGSLVVDADLFRGRHLFALRVRGDSMAGAAILDGDLAVCEPRQYAETGEVVVALIHQEEATVKRFYRRADHIELRPENPAYRPMIYGFDEVLVQGKVVGVIRGPEGIG
jgi:repressor LexA